jgi:hypothetical protein
MENQTEDFAQWEHGAYRALLRNKLLPLLHYHCGIDTTRKEKIDDAAIDRWVKREDSRAVSAPPAYVEPPPHWFQHDAPETKTVVVPVPVPVPQPAPLDGCTVMNLGGDGQLSAIHCPQQQ